MSSDNNKKKEEKVKAAFLLLGIGFVIFFLVWRFALSPSVTEEGFEPIVLEREVPKIDFDYFESEEFENFEDYEVIVAPEIEDIGRENPFLPY